MEAQEHNCPLCGQKSPRLEGLVFDIGKAFWNGQELKLSFQEIRLLHFFHSSMGRIKTHETIAEFLWPLNDGPREEKDSVRFWIKRIRSELYQHKIPLSLRMEFKIGYAMSIGPPQFVKPYKRRIT